MLMLTVVNANKSQSVIQGVVIVSVVMLGNLAATSQNLFTD